MMKVVDILLKELEQEAQITRKMLGCIPNDTYDWQPHPKSMKILALSNHIAELPGWIKMALTTDELDFENNTYNPAAINNTAELLVNSEKHIEDGRSQLAKATDEDLLPNWVLRNGDEIYSTTTKGEVIRMALSQIFITGRN